MPCVNSDDDQFNRDSNYWVKGGLGITLGTESYNTISIMKLADGTFTQNYYQDGSPVASRAIK